MLFQNMENNCLHKPFPIFHFPFIFGPEYCIVITITKHLKRNVMKTTLLLAAVLFISGATIAQDANNKQTVTSSTQVNTNVQVTKPAQPNGQASAQASASSSSQASINNNKVSNDAFVHTQAAASSETAVTAAQQVKSASVKKVHQTVATVQETGSAVKTRVKTSVQKAGNMVKPVQVNTHVQTRITSVARLGIQ
jgi:hypothetical protein